MYRTENDGQLYSWRSEHLDLGRAPDEARRSPRPQHVGQTSRMPILFGH
jgi:hypothetical protein